MDRRYPTKAEAVDLFETVWNGTENHGIFDRNLWKQHSYLVAEGAAQVVAKLPDGDPEKAFALGLLHDLGKAKDSRGKKHAIEGYHLLMQAGYADAAYAALTHDFPIKEFDIHRQESLLDDQELDMVVAILTPYTYTLYDRVVQVCDVISMPHGYVLMEKRMLTAILRYGLSRSLHQIVEAAYANIAAIEEHLDGSFYATLPGVVENTFLRQQDDTMTHFLRQQLSASTASPT
jgi:putative nucleotidyltransferase with HDIG domain